MKLPKGMFRRGKSYYTRIRSGGQDRWISLGCDYDAAKQRLGDIGTVPARRPQMMAEAAEQWLSAYVRTARNAKGARMAASRVRLYLNVFFERSELGNVRADDLRRYRLWLEEKELAPQTVVHVLCDARCFFSWCEETGRIERSPVPRRLLPRIQERFPDRLTRDEVGRLAEIPEPFGFVIRLGLATGLRWGELCRALSSDVRGNVLHVSRTKSGKVRRIPVSPELAAEVKSKSGRLVPFREADPGTFSWHARRHSGVERFHPHMMRHTFACQWLESGGSLPALQQLLGHASIATTQRYARLGDDAVRDESERTWRAQAVANAVAADENN